MKRYDNTVKNSKFILKVEDNGAGEENYFNKMLADCMKYWSEHGEEVQRTQDSEERRNMQTDDFLLKCMLMDCKTFVNSENKKAEKIIYETGRTRSHVWVHLDGKRIFMFYAAKIETAKIETLKKGDFFKRKEGAHEVYSKGEYNRSEKAWECTAESDINKYFYIKKGKEVFINFEY